MTEGKEGSSRVPEGWHIKSLAKLAEIQTGLAKGKKLDGDSVSLPYLRVANVQDGYFDLSEIKNIEVESSQVSRYSLKADDVLLTEGGDFDKLGRGSIWKGQIVLCLHQNHVFAVRVDKTQLLPYFFSQQAGSLYGKQYFLSCAKQTTNLASINSSQLKEFPVILPPLEEQRKIADILSSWDEVIEQQTRLLELKRECKRGLMQQLLTGTVRFKEFEGLEWANLPINKVAKEVSQRNKSASDLPVLSCTKHKGLVDSLSYFGKQVYSKDTSTYKVVHRGTFAYATNHIEEGSIGYQNLYDRGLISPMYTVFKADSQVIDDHFLFAVLKTEHYRQIFAANMNASVNRRGSLRWKEFANINVPVPSLNEQQKIATVLSAADAELETLEAQLSALRTQKRGLMQQLLTGKTRVKIA